MIAKAPIFVGITLSLLSWTSLNAKQEPAPPFEPTHAWLTDYDEAIAAAKKSRKPILVAFR